MLLPEQDAEPATSYGALGLRTELALRSLAYARQHRLLHDRTDGAVPGVIFGEDERGCHGNFHPLSHERILADPAWAQRLHKAHVSGKRRRVRADWHWRELDSGNSSDALLMNVFCYPGVLESAGIRATLGVEHGASPVFGFKPRTPLVNGRRDNTEVDMALGTLLVEAKLTESDFQRARPGLLTRYRDFDRVFDLAALPVRDGRLDSYQLLRGTLAAQATDCSFCVLADARRPDLLERWYAVLRAVRSADLRCRLKLLTWQELAGWLPPDLGRFLAVKYGI